MVEDPAVQTVPGPLRRPSLGVTLLHEHIFSDSSKHAPPRTSDPIFRHYDDPIRLDNQYKIRRDHANLSDQQLTDAADAVAEVALLRPAGGDTIVDLTPPALEGPPEGDIADKLLGELADRVTEGICPGVIGEIG